MEKANLPENVSFIISPGELSEKTKTMWATIVSVAPEFIPGEETEEKQFRELEGKEIWIRLA